MEILFYTLQGILIFFFLLAGAFKLAQTREKIMVSGGAWAEDISASNIKIIGIAEILLGLGLLLPLFFCLPPVISIVSAVGMSVIMAGAVVLHVKRKEVPFAILTLILSIVALSVAWYYYGSMCHTA